MANLLFDYTFHLNYLYDLLMKAGPLEKRIESTFSFLCQILNVDEVYFNTFNAGLSHMKESFVCSKFGYVNDPYQGSQNTTSLKIMNVLSQHQYYLMENIDNEHDIAIHQRYKKRGIRGFILYPIEIKQTLIGCLGIRNYHKPLFLEHSHLTLIRLVSRLFADVVELEYGVFKYMINENVYKYFFQSFPLPFVILNQDYKIIDVNPAFEQLFDILTYEIIFRNFFQVLDNYDNDKIQCLLEKLQPNASNSLEIFKVINNENKILQLMMIRLDVHDAHAHYYGVGIQDVTRAKVKERTLQRMAYYDSFTGLYNSNYLEQVCMELEEKNDQPLGIMRIKIENLRDTNLEFSYDVGDKLIIHVAKSIRTTMGSEIINARIGGGEFVVFFYNKEEDFILKKQSELYQDIDSINKSLNPPIHITIATVYSERDWQIDQLLEEVRYKSKREMLRRKKQPKMSRY